MRLAIESEPDTWRALEQRVAAILRECGVSTDVQKEIATARGTAVIDVWAHDALATPAQTYLLECKHWRARVTKSVVHGFRTVVGDSGANWGAIIALSGFQRGAREAARYSNVRLVTWVEFQSLFAGRWFQEFFLPAIGGSADPLFEYCEPFNSRIQRKAGTLLPHARDMFLALREKYERLMAVCMILRAHAILGVDSLAGEPRCGGLETFPELPLSGSLPNLALGGGSFIPRSLLDADNLRVLLDATRQAVESAVAEFDAVFDGRA